MTGAAGFVGVLILLLVLGTYVVQALIWVVIGAFHFIVFGAQALFVAIAAILRPSIVTEAWRRSQAG